MHIFGLYIYGMNLAFLARCMLLALLVWSALWRASGRRPRLRRALRAINGALALVAVYGILDRTVLGRAPSDQHTFVLASGITSEEFAREMFMNALLYFPLGLTLTAVVGPWSVAVGLLISQGVEAWQYAAGTGLSQGTDVLCNALGCAIGALPYARVPRA